MSNVTSSFDAIQIAKRAQRQAFDPRISAWVSASAGSGKTTVLTNRVLALMLAGALPQRILCLTFTKAAASEMANRISDLLARWVTLEESELADQVAPLLGREPNADDFKRARRLFARVLDAPGGMRIETIHAFCQSLLRRFPIEAGISPQFELMDERAAAEALAEARDHVIVAADPERDPALARAMAYLTGRLHETRFPELIAAIAQQRAKLERLFEAHGGLDATSLQRVVKAMRRVLNLDPDITREDVLSAACGNSAFDEAGLKRAMACLSMGSSADQTRGMCIGTWLAQTQGRETSFDEYLAAYLTQDGTVRKTLITKAACAKDPDVVAILSAEAARLEAVKETLSRLQTADATEALLCVAERILQMYRNYKRAQSLLDYDDLIQATRALLETPDIARWVLYKLDGGLDHVLIDEAQDTNPDQWAIVTALTDEFFAGEGRFEDKAGPNSLERSVFAVGDRKQSIYSFQGADLTGFDRQRETYARKAGDANRRFDDVKMNVSFRTTTSVLKAVDAVFMHQAARPGVAVGDENISHIAHRVGMAGRVEVWPPVVPQQADEPPPWKPPVERTQGDSPQNRLAGLIARRIKKMVADGEPLPARARPIRAGDIMVLVRRRTSFVDELVRQLKALDVPVAGVDRMVLPQQLAVMDLIALGEFLLLPSDDLTLATVLKSPLLGITEEQLFDLAYPRKRSLWEALTEHAGANTAFGRAHAILADLLARTDYLTPFALFSHIVVAHQGRQKALGRLGFDADDSIDEFLNLALAYEKNHAPSLQSFLHWVVQGDIEIKRDLEQAGGNAVRIMTVHGSKGLQAPIVFMPDTMQTPTQRDALLWTSGDVAQMFWVPSAKEADTFTATLRDDAKAKTLDEYRRLLYVAMTRAEDHLYICGWETKKAPGDGHWYGLIRDALDGLARSETSAFLAAEDVTLSADMLVLDNPQTAQPVTDREQATVGERDTLPPWATTLPAPERDPPQPLAPSRAAAPEPPALSPLVDDGRYRFQRGLLIHRLLQTLPSVPPAQREAAAKRYVSRPTWNLNADQQQTIVTETLKVLDTPTFAPLFGAGSLAEVPVVGLVGRHAVSGQVDRLAVTDTDVWIIDYKTNRPPPREVDNVDAAYIFQMAVYRSVLRRIYPNHNIRCVLLWTDGAYTMEVPTALMDNALASVGA
jgi:ATP-dependent helicase/nuclease subunit A